MSNPDRLTGLDASFLALEKGGAHMHVGSVLVFDGDAPAYDDFVARSRRGCTSSRATARSSRSRRSAQARPGVGRRPALQRRATTCATRRCRTPAGDEQLRQLAGRVFSQQLDRSKPLWEMWLVDRVGERPLRADLQDPPRARRRHLRCRHHDRAVRPRAGPAAARARPGLVPAARAERRRAVRGRAARARRDARSTSLRARGRAAPTRAGADAGARRRGAGGDGRRRARRRAAQPAERADRPAPALRLGRGRPRPASRRSRTRSAARSTTSC